ncbi:hypothetical protein F5051DRAFT_447103 [Lentinula edodes]|nr:hypothetical protein F5051DRAFT_447103 [Lentinula edodes]
MPINSTGSTTTTLLSNASLQQKGEEPILNIPLPSYNPKSQRQPAMPNTIDQLQKMTYDPCEGEAIIPFTTAPWQHTELNWNGRFTIHGTLGQDKKEAAKEHKERMLNVMKLNLYLVLCSNGSQQLDEGRLIIGYGFVGYQQGQQIFLQIGGMGTTTEVYDTKMARLVHGAAKAVHYTVDSPSTHILIFADNSSAITSLYNQKPIAPCQGYTQQFR